jgi:hypothetical protein
MLQERVAKLLEEQAGRVKNSALKSALLQRVGELKAKPQPAAPAPAEKK